MRYTKTQVNTVVDRVVKAMEATDLGIENSHVFQKQLEDIKEEYWLIDRRKTSLPEYTSEILFDFMELKLSYKELMAKYHCSFRSLKVVLDGCADGDDRVMDEIEARSK